MPTEERTDAARSTDRPREGTPALRFGDAWAYAPAPERVPVTIAPKKPNSTRHDALIPAASRNTPKI